MLGSLNPWDQAGCHTGPVSFKLTEPQEVGTSFPFSQITELRLREVESLPEVMQPASAGTGTEPCPLTSEWPHSCPVLNGEGGLWT